MKIYLLIKISNYICWQAPFELYNNPCPEIGLITLTLIAEIIMNKIYTYEFYITQADSNNDHIY